MTEPSAECEPQKTVAGETDMPEVVAADAAAQVAAGATEALEQQAVIVLAQA